VHPFKIPCECHDSGNAHNIKRISSILGSSGNDAGKGQMHGCSLYLTLCMDWAHRRGWLLARISRGKRDHTGHNRDHFVVMILSIYEDIWVGVWWVGVERRKGRVA
jgi:hypothetical protein